MLSQSGRLRRVEGQGQGEEQRTQAYKPQLRLGGDTPLSAAVNVGQCGGVGGGFGTVSG